MQTTLNWYDNTEPIKLVNWQILLLFDDGIYLVARSGFIDIVLQDIGKTREQIKRWAYLPKQKTE